MAKRFAQEPDHPRAAWPTCPLSARVLRWMSRCTRSSATFPSRVFATTIVFYRALSEGIEVFRVLHGARDIDGLLSDEFSATDGGREYCGRRPRRSVGIAD